MYCEMKLTVQNIVQTFSHHTTNPVGKQKTIISNEDVILDSLARL